MDDPSTTPTSPVTPPSPVAPEAAAARAPPSAPRWVIPALVGVGGLAAFLYLWNLTVSGYANTYYAMAAQAASQDWAAFFFGSLDAGNFVTLDKPPLSTWVMGLAVRLFGLSSASVLVPEALAGVATALVLFAAVRRSFGPVAGIVAALVAALTPAAVLIFRYDNPDAILTLLLVLAAYALVRSLEAGAWRWVLLAAAFVGAGFLAKYLQAWMVLPAFAFTYLVAAPGGLGRRLGQLAAAAVTVLVASLWWVAIVDAIPAASRPYIGGSETNSALDLLLGYNGLGRLLGEAPGGLGRGPSGSPFGGEPGILRLFNEQFDGQVAWFLPFALIALASGLWLTRRAPRTDARRAGYLLWGAWLLTHAMVFSFMSGIVHPYYSVVLAPAIGGLVGAGLVDLWAWRARSVAGGVVLGAAVAFTAILAAVLLARTPDFVPRLGPAVAVGGTVLAAFLALSAGRIPGRLAAAAAGLAVIVTLAGPAAYAAATMERAISGGDPQVGPATAAGGFAGLPSVRGRRRLRRKRLRAGSRLGLRLRRRRGLTGSSRDRSHAPHPGTRRGGRSSGRAPAARRRGVSRAIRTLTARIDTPSVDPAGASGFGAGPGSDRRGIAMASALILDRIAAWERAGVIDHDLADRLRAAEAAEDLRTAPPPVAAATATARIRSSGFILEFFAYLGGLFLLLAWYAWFANEMPEGEAARNRGIAVAASVPAILLGMVGWLLATRKDEHLRRAAAIAFAMAVPNAGVATWALLRVTVPDAVDDGAAPAIGAGVALALAIVARVRRPSAITQAALLAAWGAFAFGLASWVEAGLWDRRYDEYYGDIIERSPDEQFRWNVVRLGWWWLVAAIPAIVMVRRRDRGPGHEARDAVARIGIGVIAVLGSASAALAEYDDWAARGGWPIFGPVLAAGIMLGVGVAFVVAARVSGSRIHLVTAGTAIVIGLTYLNVEYVADEVGTPAALLVEGLILLGVAILGWAAGRVVTPRGPVERATSGDG